MQIKKELKVEFEVDKARIKKDLKDNGNAFKARIIEHIKYIKECKKSSMTHVIEELNKVK